ncbi:MAG: two-component regulator propeller domain-containing protein, partial [bacterium]
MNGKFSSTRLKPLLSPSEISQHNAVHAIFEDDEGRVWCGTNRGVYHIRGDSASFFFASHDSSGVEFIVQTPDGRIWFNAGENLYAYSPAAQAVERFELNISAEFFSSLFADNDRTVWIGTSRGAIYKMRDNRIVASRQAGLSAIDCENNLWLGSRRAGLYKLSERYLTTFPFTDVNLVPDVLNHTAASDAQNHLIVATEKGLWEIWKNRN